MYAQKLQNCGRFKRRLHILVGLVFLLACGCSDECRVSSKPTDAVTTNEYNRGFNDALDSITLLNLELELDGERKTFGEMNEILRERFDVPKPE